jgi:hypothetical protein
MLDREASPFLCKAVPLSLRPADPNPSVLRRNRLAIMFRLLSEHPLFSVPPQVLGYTAKNVSVENFGFVCYLTCA